MKPMCGPKETGMVLPVVLVTLVIVSGVLGVFGQLVVHQARLTPIGLLDDRSRMALDDTQKGAHDQVTSDPLGILVTRVDATGPMASISTLEQAGPGTVRSAVPVYTQWSATSPACPQRSGGSDSGSREQIHQPACTERIRFTVWAGRIGRWPRHVVQSEWAFYWPAGPVPGAPGVEGPAVRVLR